MSVLAGKVALVTGAAKGMGRAIAMQFAQEGAKVVVAARNLPEAEVVAASLPQEAMGVAIDVTRRDQWDAAIAAINVRWGALNVLVNCAGITVGATTEAVSEDDWRLHMSINLDGAFHGCRAALPLMKQGGAPGSIINISSAFGVRVVPGFAAYSVSKAALNAFSRVLALECAAAGLPIRVNSVIPGGTETDMLDRVLAETGMPREKAYAVFSRIHPMGRMGKASEVAQAALWLASDASSFTTGSELFVDGGCTIRT
ncbi:SDR family oxidoreductase [Niveispirillum sp. SYP-B3756]|nr:SDR family oxidoreductase [Niveispirillum sp. SYP-B3756]